MPALRPATPADQPFLRRLADSRTEATVRGFDDRLRAVLLAQQHLARRRAYAANFPAAEEWIILVGDAPAGAIVTERRPGVLHLVDIVLLPDAQGRGAGTSVLRQLLATADAERRVVRLMVQVANPRARALYRHLGFVDAGATDTDILMERPLSTGGRPD